MGGISAGGAGSIAGGVGDLFSGIFTGLGDYAEGKAYSQAAKYAQQNAVVSEEAGQIKSFQAERAIYKTIGAQQAEYAGAGLTSGGSAQEVLRNSISQGALEKAIINEQTQINVTGYEEQAAQFKGMATAAKDAGTAAIIGGIANAAASIVPFLSDRRLKTDIERVGSHGKLGLYSFRFIGDDERHIGVMADEVAIHAPYALGPTIEGYATVDYGKLGLSGLVQ